MPRHGWRDGVIFAIAAVATLGAVKIAYDQSRQLEAAILNRLAATHVAHWASALDQRLALSSGGGAGLASAAATGPLVDSNVSSATLKAFRLIDETGIVTVSSSVEEIGRVAPDAAAFLSLRTGDRDAKVTVDTDSTVAALAHARLPVFDNNILRGNIEMTLDLSGDAAAVMGQFETARIYGFGATALLLLLFAGIAGHYAAGRGTAVRGISRLRRTAEQDRVRRGEMLAYMSHQMRTPLNTMMGFAEVISSEMLGPVGKGKYKEYAAGIHQAGSRLMDTMADIIDLSHPEANDWQLIEEDIDTIYLANQALEAVREEADSRGIRLSLVTRNPVTRLRGDRKMTVRMLAALMSHAVGQAASGGQCRLTLTREPDGSAVFQASDTSVSLEEGRSGLSFALSGRLESNVSGSGPTGAGLALARLLAERHGAVVELSNRIGGGTCIRIRFPAARSLDIRPATRRRTHNPLYSRLAAKFAAAS